MLFAIVVAGGSGTRFNSEAEKKPKQYTEINSEPVIYITVKNLLKFHRIKSVIICVRPDDLILCEKIFQKEISTDRVHITLGGNNRISSSVNGLSFIKNKFGNQCEFVMIHDAVRPLINYSVLNELIKKVELNSNCDGALPILSISEALKKIEGDKIVSANRNLYYIAQTPQIFRFNKIIKCIAENYRNDENNESFHDESDFMQKNGYIMTHVNGFRYNIKITTPEDLKIVNYLLINSINLN